MNWKQLKEISISHFYAIALEAKVSRKLRSVCRKLTLFLAVGSFVLSFGPMPLDFSAADGLSFLFLFLYILFSLLEFFYNSMKAGPGDYALSEVIFITDEIDATRAICESGPGQEIFLRAGIAPKQVHDFVYANRVPTIVSLLNIEESHTNLADYAGLLYDSDKSLQSFLASNSVNKVEWLGAASWVAEAREKRRRRERWWSSENLGAMPSVGTSWAYGVSQDLGVYGVPFELTTRIASIETDNGYRAKEVTALESILERREESNAIIVEDDEAVARDVAARVYKKIKLGTVPAKLEHKSMIELDWSRLVADFKEKNELEAELLKLFGSAIAAGNVILYIRDFSGFAAEVKPLGLNLPSLLSPYLASPSLQVVTHTTSIDFHFFLETNPALLERFERIIPDKVGTEASLPVLLERVPSLERSYKVVFSYPAVRTVTELSDRLVTYGEMPSKALDSLEGLAPWAVKHRVTLIRENDAAEFMQEKTGIKVAELKSGEAERIERLEDLLHERVVGQDEAIRLVASAIRRARSGINNPKRPTASFLFFGPTGVGKTEVSKALAESFFGDEKKMIRFDMSEYSGPEALGRLIGSFTENKSGILAGRVRDNPYGVMLLDEFEKSAPDVLDLFLQILDEGSFTDALGKEVNCRNLIIIATSNAGSQIIWNTVKAGKSLEAEKAKIVDAIIQEKTFRPELVNRFDAVILFHPLKNTELERIARLGLEKLALRLKEKNMELVINEALVNFLVQKGSDPQFGGRSINRAIQSEVEDLIAKKIVSGEIQEGSKIEIKDEELK